MLNIRRNIQLINYKRKLKIKSSLSPMKICKSAASTEILAASGAAFREVSFEYL